MARAHYWTMYGTRGATLRPPTPAPWASGARFAVSGWLSGGSLGSWVVPGIPTRITHPARTRYTHVSTKSGTHHGARDHWDMHI